MWKLESDLDLGALWIKLKMIWTIAVGLIVNHRSQGRVSDEQAWIDGFNRAMRLNGANAR